MNTQHFLHRGLTSVVNFHFIRFKFCQIKILIQGLRYHSPFTKNYTVSFSKPHLVRLFHNKRMFCDLIFGQFFNLSIYIGVTLLGINFGRTVLPEEMFFCRNFLTHNCCFVIVLRVQSLPCLLSLLP